MNSRSPTPFKPSQQSTSSTAGLARHSPLPPSSEPSDSDPDSLPCAGDSDNDLDFSMFAPSAQTKLSHLRKRILSWNVEWGRIREWSKVFEEEYKLAWQEGRAEQWCGDVQSTVDEGRSLLEELKKVLDGDLPEDPLFIRDIWRSEQELAESLHEGMTILIARLCVVAPTKGEDFGDYLRMRDSI